MLSLNLKPLEDHLVIEPIEREQTTVLGLVIPDTAKEKPQEGKVLVVGPGLRNDNGKRIDMEVSVGDKVLFAKHAGTDIKLNGKKLLILQESDVLAIVES